jgi:hypothetical protein
VVRFEIKLEFSRQIFENFSDNRFHETFPSGSRVVPYGRTDMTELKFVFCNFANALKNDVIILFYECRILWPFKSQISESNFLFTSDNRRPTFFLLVSKLSFRSTSPPPSSDLRAQVISILSEQSFANISRRFIIFMLAESWSRKCTAIPDWYQVSYQKKIIHYANCVSVNVRVDILQFSYYSLTKYLSVTYLKRWWQIIYQNVLADSVTVTSYRATLVRYNFLYVYLNMLLIQIVVVGFAIFIGHKGP